MAVSQEFLFKLNFTSAANMVAGKLFYSKCECKSSINYLFMGLADNDFFLTFNWIVFHYKCEEIYFLNISIAHAYNAPYYPTLKPDLQGHIDVWKKWSALLLTMTSEPREPRLLLILSSSVKKFIKRNYLQYSKIKGRKDKAWKEHSCIF